MRLKQRVEDERGIDALLTERAEGTAQDGRLACADLTGEDGEALAGEDAVLEPGQNLTGVRHHVHEPRVGAGAERTVLKIEELLIHG